MDKSLFRYIWRHSRRDQLIILAVVLASLPFYFLSLDLPRKIVNEAIQGRAFESGNQTAPILNLQLSLPELPRRELLHPVRRLSRRPADAAVRPVRACSCCSC